MTPVDHWNDKYFRGELSEMQLDFLGQARDFPVSAHEFIEGVLRRMSAAGVPARDLSQVGTWVIGVLLPRLLPSAWGGIVPPITVERRHEKVEAYLRDNPWGTMAPGELILDVGCGFPPLTAVDLAASFPDNRVIGIDPSYGRDVVYDNHGDYACFAEDGHLRYFQVGAMDLDHFDELYADPEATRGRFRALHGELVGALDVGKDPEALQEISSAAGRLVRNPLRGFERHNLRFIESGVGELQLDEPAAAVRCMNVLFYFDRDFRRKTQDWVSGLLRDGGLFVAGADWVRTTNARYSVWRKEGGRLVPRELAFGIDNVRASDVVTYFAFHDDDYETSLMIECIGRLRADRDFTARFDAALDALQAEHGVMGRDDEGYLTAPPAGLPAAELEARVLGIAEALATAGVVQQAVEVLRGAGYDATVNAVGHIAILDPPAL